MHQLKYYVIFLKAIRKNIVICCNILKAEDIMLSEISQAQEDKCCVSYSYIKA